MINNSLLQALKGLGLMSVYTLVGVVLLIIGYKIFDHCVLGENHAEEVKKGNIAAGLVSGAILLALALIIHAAAS